ncbi:probable serine/threonine protein kinase IREH1 [Impatiens glandulifera]|uniref:probable serine/threonine protein kinase IREH1 n=1 Tax=Impatiens glandulifera TaxID=253017 RepID=UPI001FB18A8C|nr:probable serine/threonine protein kinase IREH1 [Impatiens glandulifera]
MVFKGRFFSSKKSDTSSPDGSNSPRSFGSNSPIRSDKKKVKSLKEDQQISSTSGSSSRQPQLKDALKQPRLKEKDLKTKEPTRLQPPSAQPPPPPSASSSASKPRKGTEVNEIPSSVTPLLASSLGLNRIKTRSGPLPQESFFGFRGEKVSAIGVSNLSKPGSGNGCSSSSATGNGERKQSINQGKMGSNENVGFGGLADNNGSNSDNMSTGSDPSRDQSPFVQTRSRLQNEESSTEAGQFSSSLNRSRGLKSSELCITPEMKTSYDFENPKESESPRFQAILRVTSAPRKRFPADIKSFSHELNSKGVRPFPLWKPRGQNNLEGVLVMIRVKFDKAKEEVDTDLHIFAADLIGILEKGAEIQPEWQETIEDLLVLARRCAMTSPGEFWLQCESIVQELDDRRQELPPGTLRQLHTRMLFILTRCTRLLQFHKETGMAEDENVFQLRQSLQVPDPVKVGRVGISSSAVKPTKAVPSSRKSYSQEQHVEKTVQTEKTLLPPLNKISSSSLKNPKESPVPVVEEQKVSSKINRNRRVNSDFDLAMANKPSSSSQAGSSKHQHKASWGYWGDQPNIFEGNSIICRICEEDVETSHVEDHSGICAVADRCDQKGLNVNDRLARIAETLEKLVESYNSSVPEDSDLLSPKLSDWSRRGSEDMLDCLHETDGSGSASGSVVFMDDLKAMSCKTRFGPKSDQGMTTSSAGSITPRSPLLTPRTSQFDLLLSGKGSFSEQDDLPQMNELADIARCVANAPLDDDRSSSYLLTCLEDLRLVIERRKLDGLTVETFGTRIEKLIREKYLQLCELVDDEKVDLSSTFTDEDAASEDDVVRSLRASPVHPSKDRTSIDDFEIIKPISRGAFGRVFLAKKRTTGDLFAMKVLRKADMICKNAVESILAERNILISVRNPFVVRFFYSFTCRENLYLVMEYLNGGDLYSLLRNLGCLDEDVARVYIAEVVLALEYLHSLNVVHRDLKPDNLLIAHDGHIKLTDFGLSKVGLIDSTDDLSGPAVSGTSSLMGEDENQLPSSERNQQRKTRSAVGTPDYLAPEILLGTGHGTTADWWSVGVILFELIVGIPPFNAEHPQMIFDNILNRKIPWPNVPEEMSYDAHDLIDRLLTEDPHQRLGARGAAEVKQHPFFRDINWDDTLARQKQAAFIPASESALDTSYFTSRYTWNPSEEHVYHTSELEYDDSENGSTTGSSSCLSNRQDELSDECGGLAEFDSGSSVNYSFSNFSFKNLSQLASINYDLLSKGLKDDAQTRRDV